MNPIALVTLGVPLLLLGFLGAPMAEPSDSVLADLVLRIGVWLSATAGVVCLWLAASSEEASDHRAAHSSDDPGDHAHAA